MNAYQSTYGGGAGDVMACEIVIPPAAGTYCTAGTTSSGCVASISGTGNASANAGSGFTMSVSNVEGQKSDLIFYGLSGQVANPWVGSSSFMCVKAPTQRMTMQGSGGSAGQCDGVLATDWNFYIANTPGALGTPFAGGETFFAQAWFRDPPSRKTTALSDALTFVVCP